VRAPEFGQLVDVIGLGRHLAGFCPMVGEGGTPQEIREGVTLEVLIEPSPRYRPTDADEEILETCRELQQYEGRPVALVTLDTVMRLRAQALGVTAVSIPAQYSRHRKQEANEQ
jgi:predicted ribonuclease YlaK